VAHAPPASALVLTCVGCAWVCPVKTVVQHLVAGLIAQGQVRDDMCAYVVLSAHEGGRGTPQALAGLPLLHLAVTKLAASPAHLTFAHAEFVKVLSAAPSLCLCLYPHAGWHAVVCGGAEPQPRTPTAANRRD
jgi:hypothetical protein